MKKLNINSWIFIVLATFVIVSCEDVVDIETDDAPTLMVVDAWLDNQSKTQVINLSYSQPYFDSSFPSGIEGAEVLLTSSAGIEIPFTEEDNGRYTWTPNTGETLGGVGDIFTLTVNANGKTLSSTAAMNRVPEIDSIAQEEKDDLFQEGIFCEFFARDMEGFGDVYWIKTFRNDTLLNKPLELNLAFDAGFDDGALIDGLIFLPPIRELINPIGDDFGSEPWETGDQVRVEIHSLNIQTFIFMERVRDQLLNSLNTIFAEPVVNSPGNIENLTDDEDVLGAFNIAAISSREILIEL